MNGARNIKSGLTRIGVWCALGGVTVVLTVLFSFLGNLSVAVVTGLVLGSARQWRWKAIPVSLVFPAVILGLSHYFKNQLPPGKVYLIAILCGAAFWGVYALAFSLHFLEQKPVVPSATANKGAAQPGGRIGTNSDAPHEFSLAALYGCWACKDAADDASAPHKTLRIEDGKFSLTVREPGGQIREIAHGEVQVKPSNSDQAVVVLGQQQRDRHASCK